MEVCSNKYPRVPNNRAIYMYLYLIQDSSPSTDEMEKISVKMTSFIIGARCRLSNSVRI